MFRHQEHSQNLFCLTWRFWKNLATRPWSSIRSKQPHCKVIDGNTFRLLQEEIQKKYFYLYFADSHWKIRVSKVNILDTPGYSDFIVK